MTTASPERKVPRTVQLLSLAKCDKCPLNSAPGPVFGHGPDNPVVALVAEAPGSEEASKGRPMIGPSGQLNDAFLAEAGLKREDVYITNTVLCRPPAPKETGQQPPPPEAIAACRGRLEAELKLVDPQTVVSTGRIATNELLGIDKAITSTAGSTNWSEKLQKYVIPTYHPSYVLRSQEVEAAESIIDAYDRAYRMATGALQLPVDLKTVEWKDCRTVDQVNAALIEIEKLPEGLLALDTETEYVGDPNYEILMVQISDGTNTWVLDAKHLIKDTIANAKFKRLLKSDKHQWVMHNATFDLKHLEYHWQVQPVDSHDTMALALCTTEKAFGIGLKKLAREYVNAPFYEEQFASHKISKDRPTSLIPHNVLAPYAAYDAYFTWHLYQALLKDVNNRGNLSLYTDILLPTARTFVDMEMTGIPVNVDTLMQTRNNWRPRRDELIEQLADVADEAGFLASDVPGLKDPRGGPGHHYATPKRKVRSERLNPRSVPQLRHLFYQVLQFKKQYAKRNKDGTGGGLTTAKEFLEKHEGNPVVDALTELRSVDKMINTYLDGVEETIWPDGKVHASFRLFGAETGRISVTEPPLQTIPADATLASKGLSSLKKMYVPGRNKVWLYADYNALELYIAYHHSGDEAIITELNKGDFHTPAYCKAFKVTLEEYKSWDKDKQEHERTGGKRVTYGIMYGRTEHGLIVQMPEFTLAELRQIIANWLAGFPDFAQWRIDTIEEVKRTGELTLLTGRKRRWRFLTNPKIREAVNVNVDAVEKEAVNFPIQGLANELCLMSLNECNQEFKAKQLGDVVLTVHDSISALVPIIKSDRAIVEMQRIMEAPKFETRVEKFPIEMKIGPNWSELKDVEL